MGTAVYYAFVAAGKHENAAVDARRMRFQVARRDVWRLTRFCLAVEAIALGTAFVLAIVHALFTRGRIVDSFLLMTFVIFLLFLLYAVLSGPGSFLSRPRLVPLGSGGIRRWREWLTPPEFAKDRELFELVMYTGLGFLLLAMATGVAALVHARGP